jgi:tetratricopeptide (TPR) repeat protein
LTINPGILAQFITALCVALAAFAYKRPVRFLKPDRLLLLLALATALGLQSRASLIGLLAATTYLYAPQLKKYKGRIIIISIVLLFISIFFFKTGSSSGRMLIYKITFSNLSLRDYVFGLGTGGGKPPGADEVKPPGADAGRSRLGGFRANYNHWQSNYFASGNRNIQEQLLADNVSYLYNDWLQFALELGLVGMAIVLICRWLFFKIFVRAPAHTSARTKLFTANAVLIFLSTTACFSFTLQATPTCWLFCLALLVHARYTYSLRTAYRSTIGKGLFKLLAIAIFIFIVIRGVVQLYANKISNEAYHLSAAGMRAEALHKLERLHAKPFCKTALSLYHRAFVLHELNRSNEAVHYLQQSIEKEPSHVSYLLLGDIYNDLQEYQKAEANYLQAACMVPNRLRSKNKLVQFYKERGDSLRAEFWWKQLLETPIKIKSKEADELFKGVGRAIIYRRAETQ